MIDPYLNRLCNTLFLIARCLNGDPKAQEELAYAKTASKPETTGLAGLPTLREQAAIVSAEKRRPLVPSMRRSSGGKLENQEDKGGGTEEVSNETRSHTELVMELHRLHGIMVACRCEQASQAKLESDPFYLGVIAGKILAYVEIISRLNQLIASESETKPKEG